MSEIFEPFIFALEELLENAGIISIALVLNPSQGRWVTNQSTATLEALDLIVAIVMRPLLEMKQWVAVRVRRRQWWHESRDVKVSVWWDFENCQVPAGVNALDVAPAITKAVRASGIKGPLRINAFGDVLQLSKPNRQALSHTGIHFTHIKGFLFFSFILVLDYGFV